MSELNIDLHTHTNCSDGQLSPEKLIDRARAQGVDILSITDHDTLEAYTDTVYKRAQLNGITLIPGVEISTVDSDGDKAHILGLGVDPGNDMLLRNLADQNESRQLYVQEVAERLLEGGWELEMAPLLSRGTTITKAHIARAVIMKPENSRQLLRTFGQRPTTGQFIEKFLVKGTEFYVPVEGMMTPAQAVSLIHYAGGLASYAHPVAALFESAISLPVLEKKIKTSGVDAVEAEYIYFSKRLADKRVDMRPEMRLMTRKLGLYISGGSDFHGTSSDIGNFIEVGSEIDSTVISRSLIAELQEVHA